MRTSIIIIKISSKTTEKRPISKEKGKTLCHKVQIVTARQRNEILVSQASNTYLTPKKPPWGKEVNRSNAMNSLAENVRQKAQEKSGATVG